MGKMMKEAAGGTEAFDARLIKFCPECLDDTDCNIVDTERLYKFGKDSISVNLKMLNCSVCGELFPDLPFEEEAYKCAAAEYRKKNGIVSPHEIAMLREKYDMSQRELASVLGWSHATVSRYENGVLPDIAHNMVLTVIRDEPERLLELISKNMDIDNVNRFGRLYERVKVVVQENNEQKFVSLLKERFNREPNIFTGFKSFSYEKVCNTVIYFAKRDPRLYKVKLLKYLWYADFLHFKRNAASITGLLYEKYAFGPVPRDYEFLLRLIEGEKSCVLKEYVDLNLDNPGEKYTALCDYDPNQLDPEEVNTLESVLAKIRCLSSAGSAALSHEEKAWLETDYHDPISYEYAFDISLD